MPSASCTGRTAPGAPWCNSAPGRTAGQISHRGAAVVVSGAPPTPGGTDRGHRPRLLDHHRRHRRRSQALRWRLERHRRLERAPPGRARAPAHGPRRRPAAHPGRFLRAQHRPRGDGRHREHRRRPRRPDVPGQQRDGRSHRSRREGHEVRGGRHRDHPLQRRAGQVRIPVEDLGVRSARVGGLVRQGGRRRRLADHQGAARLRSLVLGDRGAAAPRAHGLSPLAARARHLPRQGHARAPGHAQRARLRRRCVRTLPHERHRRGPQCVLLLGEPRAAGCAREAGYHRNRPEGVQPLRQPGRHASAFNKPRRRS